MNMLAKNYVFYYYKCTFFLVEKSHKTGVGQQINNNIYCGTHMNSININTSDRISNNYTER